MKILKCILLVFVGLLIFETSSSQINYSNNGNSFIHENGFQIIEADFYNLEQGIFNVDGTVWINGNLINEGIISFSDSVNSPHTIKMEGKNLQHISGNGLLDFYNIRFFNQNLQGFIFETTINIHNKASFEFGILEIPSDSNRIVFKKNSKVQYVSSNSFVDGRVQKEGNSGFIFPVGNAGNYRFAAIAAPELETDIFSARYLNSNPADFGMDINSYDSEIAEVSNTEFWEIRRENGSSTPDITLSWDSSTGAFIPNEPEVICIVRWDGNKWVNEGNVSWQGNSEKGSVTAQVSEYGFFTLARIDNNTPVAENDTFFAVPNQQIQGNLINNDFDPDGHLLSFSTDTTYFLESGELNIQQNGDFIFTPLSDYVGESAFLYTVCDNFIPAECASAFVVFVIDEDSDNDLIPDLVDLDDDNDGIPDEIEGNGLVDSDNDGIPDSIDTDSDNDEIPDAIEGHIVLIGNSFSVNSFSGNDENNNGLDDAFDVLAGGSQAVLSDNDFDGIPDWIDDNDDNDNFLTSVEIAHMKDYPLSIDSDNDGIPDYLDNDSPAIYAENDFEFTFSGVAVEINVVVNDSPELISSSIEIIDHPIHGTAINNGDGTITYTPDNNFAGTEIIQYRICTETNICVLANIEVEVVERLFIPEIITPNGDGKNDIFEIKGIERFENARMIIFNRWGDKIFESENYMNNWSGENNRNNTNNDKRLPAGTYYYILEYNTNKHITGFIYLEW